MIPDQPIKLLDYPESLKPGDFVAVCPHLDAGSVGGNWAPGGQATNSERGTSFFNFRVLCGRCVGSESVEFRRAKFYDGKLNFGWWRFEPSAIGRPKKK